ncbi:phosphotransferase family protein [Pelagibius marinus]|uniref:phosphotransferase family protein n=1 Tax=Pelagibius marinus TaxID=2762760 RepID=UPI00221FD8EE|nr:phosphotransferase [Pelagibius marinus]
MLDDLDPQARLVHCDFDPSNILLTRDGPEGGDSWRLAAVIDWEFALAGTPLIDLGHLLRPPQGDIPGFAEALAAGYREAGGELPGEWRAAAKLLDLLAWLDFLNRPGDHPRLFADARRMIEDALVRWPDFRA